MKKRNKVAQLSMVSGQRQALLKALAVSLFEKGKIKTTLTKARVLKPFVEKKISLAKLGLLADQRLAKTRVLRRIFSEKTVKQIFNWAEVFRTRPGGYCRIVKLPFRPSDAAPMGLIEMVEGLKDKKVISSEKKKPNQQRKKDEGGSLKDKINHADEK